MNILIIMHHPAEGPGTLGEYLRGQGAGLGLVRLHEGDRLPADARYLDGVISLGGPMNVYQDGMYPFLRREAAFIRQAVGAGVPFLGICLGAQMLARACEARVGPSPVKEVGWGEVSLTRAGRGDALLRGLPDRFTVLQWHEDMFEVPEGGELLAAADGCPHQAFRVGMAWGLQFHVEIDEIMLADWFSGSPGARDILVRYAKSRDDLQVVASTIGGNFLQQVQEQAFLKM